MRFVKNLVSTQFNVSVCDFEFKGVFNRCLSLKILFDNFIGQLNRCFCQPPASKSSILHLLVQSGCRWGLLFLIIASCCITAPFIICYKLKCIFCVLERKTINDLACWKRLESSTLTSFLNPIMNERWNVKNGELPHQLYHVRFSMCKFGKRMEKLSKFTRIHLTGCGNKP